MKKNIQTRDDLKAEIARLTLEKEVAEQNLNRMVREYSVAMKPVNLLKNAFGSVKNDKELSGMLKTRGLEALMGFVVSQLVFKNSGTLVKTAATLMGTTFASGVFGDDAMKYVEKIKKLFGKFRSKGSDSNKDNFTEEDIYK